MPVLKVKKDNGVWQDIATANSHAHTMKDITDLPASLVDDVEALKDKVGAESVAYQISSVIQASEYVHPFTHPADMITGLADVAISGSFNDLTDLPEDFGTYTHPETHPASMITGLANIATSGDYNDLENKPVIPSVDGLATKSYVDEKIASIDITDIQALPEVTADDNDKVLTVVGGEWDIAMPQVGVSSWNDLEDKPFYEELGMVTLFPEQEVSGFQPDPMYGLPMKEVPCSFLLVPGETYHVKWKEDVWTCVAIDGSSMLPGCVGIGNAYAFGYPDSGQPFAILTFATANTLGVIPLDQSETVSVGVFQEGMVVTTIDDKFIPMDFIDRRIDEKVEECKNSIDERIEEYLNTILEGDY